MNIIGPYQHNYRYAMPRLPETRGGQPNPVTQITPPRQIASATPQGAQAMMNKAAWYRVGAILNNMFKVGNFSYPGGPVGAPVPGYIPAADPSMQQGPPAGSMMPGDPLMSGGMPPMGGGGMPPMDPMAAGGMPPPPPPIPAPPPPQQPRPRTSDEAYQEAEMLQLMEQKDNTMAADQDITSDVMGSGEKFSSSRRLRRPWPPQYALLELYLR